MPIYEILVAMGLLVALAADALTVIDILSDWWKEHKHDRTDGEETEGTR